MSDSGPSGVQVVRWISSWASVIAPASVLSTLLFYFGYVSARSQYEYFGVDVDTIGLGTQEYIMRSPEPLLVPLLVLTLLGAALLVLHAAIRNRIAASAGTRLERVQRTARVGMGVGLAALGAAVVLLFTYTYVRDWAFYNLVTPLLFTVGGGLVAYTSHVSALLRRPRHNPGPAAAKEPEPRTAADSSVLLRRTAVTFTYAVMGASLFWATATVAQWSGRGLAQDQARHLDRLPRVILDTKEQLYLRSPGVEMTILPASEGQTYRYRYRRLRLLIVGKDRMFLVPEQWSASNSTLVVPLDGSMRVQFQFQNRPP